VDRHGEARDADSNGGSLRPPPTSRSITLSRSKMP